MKRAAFDRPLPQERGYFHIWRSRAFLRTIPPAGGMHCIEKLARFSKIHLQGREYRPVEEVHPLCASTSNLQKLLRGGRGNLSLVTSAGAEIRAPRSGRGTF